MICGRKPSKEITMKILTIIRELKLTTPETIRTRYETKYGEKPAWRTIRKHLDALLEDDIVRERIITRGKGRTIAVYSLVSKSDNV